jgi:hypothetical protein
MKVQLKRTIALAAVIAATALPTEGADGGRKPTLVEVEATWPGRKTERFTTTLEKALWLDKTVDNGDGPKKGNIRWWVKGVPVG